MPWSERGESTEARHPRAKDLDSQPLTEVVHLLWQDHLEGVEKVREILEKIAAVAELYAATLRKGGRVFYVGAGTSGRLGVLDVVELPPSFGLDPRSVQAILSGGDQAFSQAKEESEDDHKAGKKAIQEKDVTSSDLVIGISASGRTPFVLGAMVEARARGAKTVGITNNPGSPLVQAVDFALVIPTGPELVAGSTRLKAGTAQKVVLNIISTAAMIALGKVYQGLMVEVEAQNEKLRARAEKIVAELAGAPLAKVREALAQAKWRVKPAVLMLKGNLSFEEAEALLERCGRSLRAALEKVKTSEI